MDRGATVGVLVMPSLLRGRAGGAEGIHASESSNREMPGRAKARFAGGFGCEKGFFFTPYILDDLDAFHEQERSESYLRCMTTVRVAPQLSNLCR
jgi:hypothetical protein